MKRGTRRNSSPPAASEVVTAIAPRKRSNDNSNDTLAPGAGSDAVDGQDGNDTLLIRDGAADLARGGAGTDSATVDHIDAVAADVENVDRAKSGAHALSIGKTARVTLKNGK
jgi:Ca2+-binding RTX toxin-like protein